MPPSGQARRRRESAQPLWLLAAPEAPPSGSARAGSSRVANLSRERIVAAAVAIADDEGPTAVTMRRIARDLNVSPMALYWHVANKDDLLALMVDAVEGEVDVVEPSGDWRADITTTARRYRQALLRHGWMTSFIGLRRALGPNELPHIERSLAALDDLGLTIREAFNVLMAVETYYLGFAIREQQELAAELARTPIAPARRRAYIKAEAERLRDTGQYPHLVELFAEGTFLTRDERFEFGLARLLDGIEAELARTAVRRRP